jgi:signal transduction histidine kinase
MYKEHQNNHQVKYENNRQKQELEAAFRISQALFKHQKVEDLVQEALQTALEIVDAQAGSVLLLDPETKELVFYHSVGEKAPKPGTRIPCTQGIAGLAFQSETPLVCGDVKQDNRHFGEIDEATGFTTHDLIALPLKCWKGKPIGVLEVLNKRHGRLDDQDVAILSIISTLTGLFIEQSRLFEEAKVAEIIRLLGDIGHDIKNMLMPILNGTWLLKDELNEHFTHFNDTDSRRMKASEVLSQEILEMIGRNAHRIQDRVREIADAVKGVSSPPRFNSCKVAEIVGTVHQTLELLAREKGISLQTAGLHDLPLIQADERRLFNAFYNLINNAIPEVPAGGTITVRGRIKEEASSVVLSVEDTGKGMPPEVRDSLFTARAVSSKPGGTGLGTKIVKDVVAAHGGAISVESQEGVGTTFHIHLPLDATSVCSC